MKRVKDAAKESPGPGAVFFLGGDAPLRDPRQNRPQGTPALLKRRRCPRTRRGAHKRPVRALLALTGHFRALRTPVMRASRVLAPAWAEGTSSLGPGLRKVATAVDNHREGELCTPCVRTGDNDHFGCLKESCSFPALVSNRVVAQGLAAAYPRPIKDFLALFHLSTALIHH